MASLKEVKNRISSVRSTQKITQAMKMVASAKLHRAQQQAEHARLYEIKFLSLLNRLINSVDELESQFLKENEGTDKVAIVVVASNSGMCGGFNTSIVRQFEKIAEKYTKEQLLLFPVGRKVGDILAKKGYRIDKSFHHLVEKSVTYIDSAELTRTMMELYMRGEVARVELLYYDFVTPTQQKIKHDIYLPYTVVEIAAKAEIDLHDEAIDNYLIEPSLEKVIDSMLPRILNFEIFYALLSSYASEQRARTVSMQMATENANDILNELQTEYNKLRQQGITTELLDIIGGSFA